MCSFKKTLTLISLFWKKMKGIFMQEIFTNETLEWQDSFVEPNLKEIITSHIQSCKGKISYISLRLQSIIWKP
jgi:hypothetical protein